MTDEAPPPLAGREQEGPIIHIGRVHDLRQACARWKGAARIAIDTEANSMHAYREQTCIVQASVEAEHVIIDSLAVTDLSPLRDLIDTDEIEVLLHGGDYDISCLSRDHEFRFHRVFDTMIAATLLGLPKVGLADLVRENFGVELDKRFQRSDWGRRPLSDEQIDYLHRDTLYLAPLRDHLHAELAAADLLEEAEIEFRRLTTRQGKVPAFDPDGWRRMKGVNRLSESGRAILHELWAWRDGVAESRDTPAFKVFPPAKMLKLAASEPRKAHHPRTLPFLSHAERSRYGKPIVAALQRAFERVAAGDAPPQHLTPRPTAAELTVSKARRKRVDRIKAWRKAELQKRDVPGVVVLPNPAVEWLIDHEPKTIEEMAACPDIGPKRLDRYGEKLLELLKPAP